MLFRGLILRQAQDDGGFLFSPQLPLHKPDQLHRFGHAEEHGESEVDRARRADVQEEDRRAQQGVGRARAEQVLIAEERDQPAAEGRESHPREEGEPVGRAAEIDLLLDRPDQLQEVEDRDEPRCQCQPDMAEVKIKVEQKTECQVERDADEADP